MGEHHDDLSIADRFLRYLQAQLYDSSVGYASPMVPLQGGFETASYRFELAGVADALAGPQVLRLYPAFYGPHNAIWESTVQNALAAEGMRVARARFLCTDLSVLGGAFFVMDYIPGKPLAAAPRDDVPGLLGTTHAELHELDPVPVVVALEERGIDPGRYGLDSRYHWLSAQVATYTWIRPAVEWLLAHRPAEPARLSVCHGDFHPFNLLYADGKVTGVLDWPGFAIGDPVYDVGNTLVLLTIAAKHLTGPMDAFASVDWGLMAELYLEAYERRRHLDRANLDFYRVRRCLAALIEGAEGQRAWQHPLVVKDLVDCVLHVTGIQVKVPDSLSHGGRVTSAQRQA